MQTLLPLAERIAARLTARREWVLRMAIVKDAVRMWLQRRGGPQVYPTDVRVSANGGERLQVASLTSSRLTVPTTAQSSCYWL